MKTAMANKSSESIESMMTSLGEAARRAASELALTSIDTRNRALQSAADSIRENIANIIAANKLDMASANEKGLTAAMLDRLMLDDERIEAMASGTESIIELQDPIGRMLAAHSVLLRRCGEIARVRQAGENASPPGRMGPRRGMV